MVAPGLYELECKACGAPIHPPAESTVVRCEHCGQPHVWVAPRDGEHGKWVPERTAARRSPLPFLIGGGIVVVALVAMGLGAVVFMRARAPLRAVDAAVTADTPLEIGDTVTYHMTRTSSCTGFVARLLPDGRALVGGCGADSGIEVGRALLTLGTYAYITPEADDVVLEHTATSWSRVVVLGSDAGNTVRVEPLLGGAAHSVASSGLRVVRPRNQAASMYWLPIPASVAIEVGDVVSYSDGAMMKQAKVTRIDGDQVELENGYEDQGTFKPSTSGVPARRARNLLLAQLASPFSPPPQGDVLLAKKDAKWQRVSLLSTAEHGRWTVRAADSNTPFTVWGGEVLLLHRGSSN